MRYIYNDCKLVISCEWDSQIVFIPGGSIVLALSISCLSRTMILTIPYSIKLLKRSSFREKIKELVLNFLWSEDDYVEVSRLIKVFNTLG